MFEEFVRETNLKKKHSAVWALHTYVIPMILPITMPNEAYEYLQCILMQMQSWPWGNSREDNAFSTKGIGKVYLMHQPSS